MGRTAQDVSVEEVLHSGEPSVELDKTPSSESLKSQSKLIEARTAFNEKNPSASKIIHDLHVHAKEAHQGTSGEYVQSVVFGGLDGIITTFAIVAAAAGASLSYGLILIIGFANVLGDAVGMAVGDYLSSVAEGDHESAERKRETWELDNIPEAEKEEMVDIYTSKGISVEDAREVVELLYASSKPAFLDVMIVEELGILPKGAETAAWKGALVTFVSFLACGGLPMLPYLFSAQYDKIGSFDDVFGAALALFCVTLFTLGAFKGRITGKRWYITGMTMLFNGAATTAVAFLIGFAFQHIK